VGVLEPVTACDSDGEAGDCGDAGGGEGKGEWDGDGDGASNELLRHGRGGDSDDEYCSGDIDDGFAGDLEECLADQW